MNWPKISVITPAYNSEEYLEEAIKSVLAQDYDNFEHIVVDGGSTDNTLNILKSYSHLKWISEADRGQAHAMNKGFKMSDGDIVVYLNADDYFLPGVFKKVAGFFVSGSEFVVGNVKVIKDNGESIINDPQYTLEQMLKWWKPDYFCYNPVGYFYLRKIQEQIPFNESNHYSMDYEFMLDAATKCQIHKIDEVLGVFRHIQGTKTCSRSNQWKKVYRDKMNIVEKYVTLCGESYSRQYYEELKEFMHASRKRDFRVSCAEFFKKFSFIYPFFRYLYRKFLKKYI